MAKERWNLLSSAYDVDDACAALPGWIAKVEQEERCRVPSAQFWTELRMALDLDCIVGCNPRVAPSCFPQALKLSLNGHGEGWVLSLPPSGCLESFPTLMPI